MNSERSTPAGPSARAITTRDALRSGATPQELYGGAFTQPHRGVQIAGSISAPIEIARAFLPRMRAWHAFSDVTAALFWGLPLPRRFDQDATVHIVVPTGRNKPTGAGIRGRSIHPDIWQMTAPFGEPLTPPELTWALLARVLSIRELVVVGDALATTSGSYRGIIRPDFAGPSHDVFAPVPELASAASLAGVLASWGRNVGATRMRAALPQVRPGVESPMETLTRLIIVDAGFPEPVVGYRVHAGQVFIGRVDLAYPELKIAVEYDGEYHWDPEQAKKDVARINRLQEAGWLVIRITSDDLFKRRAAFFAQLRAARKRAK